MTWLRSATTSGDPSWRIHTGVPGNATRWAWRCSFSTRQTGSPGGHDHVPTSIPGAPNTIVEVGTGASVGTGDHARGAPVLQGDRLTHRDPGVPRAALGLDPAVHA